MQYPEWIWHNGGIKPWAEATTHVMSHALHYGSSVFEGIRSYDTPDGPAIFRLTDHNRRLFASAKIYDMPVPYAVDDLNRACREVLKANGLGKAYLRPVAYRGLGGFGLSAETPVDVVIVFLPRCAERRPPGARSRSAARTCRRTTGPGCRGAGSGTSPCPP